MTYRSQVRRDPKPAIEMPDANPPPLPLVIDLDGTLSRTDVMHEALLRLAARKPFSVTAVALTLRQGKTAFKSALADLETVPPESLVFNEDVLSLIQSVRADNRKVLLVSASDHRQVTAVGSHLDLFDEAIGTGSTDTGTENLSGQSKASFLVDRYGQSGFDYVGDSATDLPVWKAARKAYAVAPSERLKTQARAAGVNLLEVGGNRFGTSVVAPYFRAVRPHQWIKNILVFLPLLAAQQLDQLPFAILAFALFSMIASSVYLFNDLVDLASDRAHPRKRHRPFAAGTIPLKDGVMLGTGLLFAGLGLAALFMPADFFVVLLVYFIITVAYSFWLKRKLIVDTVTLAGLYTMRIIAGGAATGIMPSPWLLAFSVFLFYALASIKRQAELVDLAKRKTGNLGRGYLASDVHVVQAIAVSSGQAAVLVFALYLYSPTVTTLYTTPEILWLICPLLLYWLSRLAILTHRGQMDDDPILFAARDRVSLITFGLAVLIVILAETVG